jgi:hypothetical protein
MQTHIIQAAVIMAAGMVIGGFLAGGIFDISSTSAATWKVNRLTGTVYFCAFGTCTPMQ